ncbi:MAG: PDZ domain-containing protein, partial [Clostridia bacterium]|nr:PDZ domain-containing protein [Clostridia bacterium]
MEYINQSEPYQTEQRSERRIRTLLWILIPVIWVLSLILVGVAVYIATKPVRTDDEALMDAIRDMRYCIRENYYFYDEDEEKLTNAALKGMASGTGDDYAYYYSAEEYAALQKQNEGNFVGIGILTSMDENGAVRIIDVYDNTPASEAGLTAGDQMIEINGVSYEGLDLNGFLGNVIAEDGAENTIKVLRDGEELTFTIVAREVHTPSVSYRMLTDTIGYIRVSTFHGTCVQETEDALKDLKEQGM